MRLTTNEYDLHIQQSFLHDGLTKCHISLTHFLVLGKSIGIQTAWLQFQRPTSGS